MMFQTLSWLFSTFVRTLIKINVHWDSKNIIFIKHLLRLFKTQYYMHRLTNANLLHNSTVFINFENDQ